MALSMPEDMERPRRRCHVVVDATIEALIGAMRDNPQGVILYSKCCEHGRGNKIDVEMLIPDQCLHDIADSRRKHT